MVSRIEEYLEGVQGKSRILVAISKMSTPSKQQSPFPIWKLCGSDFHPSHATCRTPAQERSPYYYMTLYEKTVYLLLPNRNKPSVRPLVSVGVCLCVVAVTCASFVCFRSDFSLSPLFVCRCERIQQRCTHATSVRTHSCASLFLTNTDNICHFLDVSLRNIPSKCV